MAIDASIPLRAVQPRQRDRDPMREYANMLQISEMQDQRGKRNAFEQAAQGAVGPDGKINYDQLKGAYASTGNIEGAIGIDTQLNKRDKSASDAQTAQFNVAMQRLGIMGQVLGSAKDQASYSSGRLFMQQNSIDVADIPEQYDPAWVANAAQQTLTAEKRIELAMKERRTVAAEQGRFGTSVNVNTGDSGPRIGTVPPGYQATQTESGDFVMEPIPGGPAERDDKDAARKREAHTQTVTTAGQVLIRDVTTALQTLEEHGRWAGGFGAWLKGIPESSANSLASDLGSLQGTIAVQELLKIKQSGAGLGQVPQSQLEMLASLLGSIRQDMPIDKLAANLKQIRDIYAEIVRREGGDPFKLAIERGYVPEGPGSSVQTSGAPDGGGVKFLGFEK